jgi:N-formylglutamate deformylase
MVNHSGLTEPDARRDRGARLAWHAPYHAALAAELERVKAIHGVAILYDCHSIRSKIPYLFRRHASRLQHRHQQWRDLRSGDRSCGGRNLRGAEGYSSVLNGRFKGGWTTRHYGRPAENMHAIQMELAQIRIWPPRSRPSPMTRPRRSQPAQTAQDNSEFSC